MPDRPRVCVAGSLHFDIMVRAPYLPRVGETLMGEAWWWKQGGKGGNQAVAAARHGAAVTMIGALGADGFGRHGGRRRLRRWQDQTNGLRGLGPQDAAEAGPLPLDELDDLTGTAPLRRNRLGSRRGCGRRRAVVAASESPEEEDGEERAHRTRLSRRSSIS